MHPFTEPQKQIPIAGDADVIVCGAGPAGMAAALAAARCGARTRLIEMHGCLGGVWTAGQLAWLFEMEQPGIPQEITRRLDARGARIGKSHRRYSYNIEAMKHLLEELCQEAGVEFRLHTRLADAVVEGDRLQAAITESKSGREAWTASCFVDATGDGDLGARAGCGFELGRPGSGACQPMTFMALITVRDAEALSPFISFWGGEWEFKYHHIAHPRFLAEIRRGGEDPSYAKPTLFQVNGNLLALMINHEYGVSALDADAITAATVRARAEVNRVVAALERLGGPWRGIALAATAEYIGVREGRRLDGLYRVSEADVVAGVHHPDAICRVFFGVDIHSTDPEQGKGQEDHGIQMQPYDIPLRALISRDVDNLLLAGRCISGDFVAHASYRVSGTAAATGQAAGATAALAAQRGQDPAEIPWSAVANVLETKVWQ